jgi:hypothetical protein
VALADAVGSPYVGVILYLRVHASGDIGAEQYDRCVEQTAVYLRRLLATP